MGAGIRARIGFTCAPSLRFFVGRQSPACAQSAGLCALATCTVVFLGAAKVHLSPRDISAEPVIFFGWLEWLRQQVLVSARDPSFISRE